MTRINYPTLRDKLSEETGVGKRSIAGSLQNGFSDVQLQDAEFRISEENPSDYVQHCGGRIPLQYYRIEADDGTNEKTRDVYSFKVKLKGITKTKLKVTSPKKIEESFSRDSRSYLCDVENLEWYE